MANNPKKILIVEDEVSISEALEMKLTHEGYQVFLAENGQVGLDLALAEKPDLILLDIVMPVMDGITMLQKFREHEAAKDTEVVVLTNSSHLDKEKSVEEFAVAGFLIKSEWKLSDLVEKIKTIIK